MADQVITKQELIDAQKDAQSLDSVINGDDNTTVITRKNRSYPSIARAIKKIIETGGFEPFATESALKASVPVLTKKAAKALDTGKIWLWQDGAWNDTGLSELDRAKKYTDDVRFDATKQLSQFSNAKDAVVSQYRAEGMIAVADGRNAYAVGIDLENSVINHISFSVANLFPNQSVNLSIYERTVDGPYTYPGENTDKLVFTKDYVLDDLLGYKLVNEPIVISKLEFKIPTISATKKTRYLFVLTATSSFKMGVVAVSPSDPTLSGSLGGFYKTTDGWAFASLGTQRIAYSAEYKTDQVGSQSVASSESIIDKRLSENIGFYHYPTRNWTLFGRGFSAYSNQKFNKIGLWLSELSTTAQIDYRIIARPNSLANTVSWIGANYKDKEIFVSSVNVANKYASDNVEHLIEFDFDENLVPENHFVMILITARKADNSVSNFGIATYKDTTTSTRVDKGAYLIDNQSANYIDTGTAIAFVLSKVKKIKVDDAVSEIKNSLDNMPMLEQKTPIFEPILNAESTGLKVDLNGTVINQIGKQTVITSVVTHEPSISATATKTSTLNKSDSKVWISNPNEFLGYCNISNVVVTNTATGTALVSGVHYDVDAFGGKLIGLTSTVYSVSVSFTYTNQRYDLIQINPFTLAVTIKKGVERSQDPSEWMVEVDAPNRALCRVLVTGNNTEIVPLDEYISCGGKPYSASPELTALKIHNQSCLKRVFAKLNKGQNISLVGYGDSITAMGGYHTEDIPNENHDWYGFFATLPQDTQNAKVPTFNYESGSGGRMHIGWNWKLKEYLEKTYANTIKYWNYGVSGTDSTDGARDTRLQYPLSKNPDLVVVAFGMNDAGSSALYANLVKIVNTFKSAGADVVLMPVVRTPTLPFVNYQGDSWRQVNRFIYSAAIDSGAAYCPIDWYADDAHYGGMGINFKHFCTQNMFNHPGPYEYSIYGKILVSVFE